MAEPGGTPWWLTLIAGIAMAIVGLFLLAAPGAAITTLTLFLGIYFLIDGILRLVSMFIDHSGWGWKLLLGILGIIAGIIVIQHPYASAIIVPAAIVIYLGILGIVIGALEIFAAFKGAGWGTGILGAVSVLLGLVLLFNPLVGALALPWVLGFLALVGGVATAIASFFQRKAH
jgi:uncharacterized membrane protein HdeD (DUF308 family)